MSASTARKKFRALLKGPNVIPAPGVWDPFSARVVERVGFECVHLGGYQMGIALVTTEPLMTMTELTTLTHYVCNAVEIPVIVDAATGFGEPLHVMRTVREMEKAGAAGIHIEDQIYPKRVHYHKGVEHTIPREEMLVKLKAALKARTDPDFTIIARTDAMRTESFEEGVARANLFLEAGADMVMVFPNNLEEARRAPHEIKGPICYVNSEGNMLPRPTFTIKEFQDMGYKLITYPSAPICAVTQELKRVVTNIKTKGSSGFTREDMVRWRKETEDLIGLEEYYKIEADTVEH
jgi:methylisocitrate lyase